MTATDEETSVEMTLTIKCNSDKSEVTTTASSTVLELKQKIEVALSVPAAQQRLIYRGKVLKDDNTLQFYEIDGSQPVHMVKGMAPPAPAASTPAVTPASSSGNRNLPSNTPYASTSTTTTSNPFSMMNASASSPFGNMPGMDSLLNNPDIMSQMMNSPIMDSIMSNPDMLRNMITNNPEMQAMLDSNPHIRHVLNDPSTLRHTMEMMRNPNAMREAMRSQDLAMSHLENIPGGFNALRRMYEEVQEPMMEAAQSRNNSMFSNSNNNSTNYPSVPSPPQTSPNTAALPNPWGSVPTPAPSNNTFNSNSNASMGNPFANMGGMGGMGGMPNPSQMGSMLSNPGVQQMMQQMMSNPAMINQMAAGNPQLAAALNNPQTRQMLSSPEMLRMMSDPAAMEAIMQMNNSMSVLNSRMPGMFNGLGAGAMPGAGAGAGAGGFDLSSILGGGSNGSGALQMPPSLPVPAPVTDPATTYAVQLRQLQDMGFFDTSANIRALQSTGGNVNAAVERLLSGL